MPDTMVETTEQWCGGSRSNRPRDLAEQTPKRGVRAETVKDRAKDKDKDRPDRQRHLSRIRKGAGASRPLTHGEEWQNGPFPGTRNRIGGPLLGMSKNERP